MRTAAPLVAALATFALAAAVAAQDAGGPPPVKGPPAAEFFPFEKAQGPEVTDGKSRLAATQNGERLYNRTCGVCHLGGGMAVLVLAQRLPPDQVLLHRRSDLTPEFVETVARQGLGSMPPITRVDATDAELKAIAQYLGSRR